MVLNTDMSKAHPSNLNTPNGSCTDLLLENRYGGGGYSVISETPLNDRVIYKDQANRSAMSYAGFCPSPVLARSILFIYLFLATRHQT